MDWDSCFGLATPFLSLYPEPLFGGVFLIKGINGTRLKKATTLFFGATKNFQLSKAGLLRKTAVETRA